MLQYVHLYGTADWGVKQRLRQMLSTFKRLRSPLRCKRGVATIWKLIKWRNLSLEARCVLCMDKYTQANTHTQRTVRPYARDVVGLVVCLHHMRVLACSLPLSDKKQSLLCVDSYCSHPHLAPPGLCRGAGKQNHIHTPVYVFPDSLFFPHLILFSFSHFLLMLIWFSSFRSFFSAP